MADPAPHVAGGPRARLGAARLAYPPGQGVFTASSGAVPALRAVYLALDYGDVTGRGEVRTNIAYLTGIPAARLEGEIAARLPGLPLSADPAEDLARLDALLPGALAGTRLLLAGALLDAAARRAGVTAAALLGGAGRPLASPTNQTLFLADDATMLARAEAYVARGFAELKLRIGAGAPQDDLDRLARLRDRFGAGVTLSADVNGRWDRATARRLAPALLALGLDYLEQPLAAEDVAGALALAADTGLAVMFDESATGPEAIARIADAVPPGARVLVHLKLAKLGGFDRLLDAARIARDGGLGLMVGQMNEGALATAAALAAAVAVAPDRAELYGADGILEDPFGGLVYGGGEVRAAGATGFGVEVRREPGPLVPGEDPGP